MFCARSIQQRNHATRHFLFALRKAKRNLIYASQFIGINGNRPHHISEWECEKFNYAKCACTRVPVRVSICVCVCTCASSNRRQYFRSFEPNHKRSRLTGTRCLPLTTPGMWCTLASVRSFFPIVNFRSTNEEPNREWPNELMFTSRNNFSLRSHTSRVVYNLIQSPHCHTHTHTAIRI